MIDIQLFLFVYNVYSQHCIHKYNFNFIDYKLLAYNCAAIIDTRSRYFDEFVFKARLSFPEKKNVKMIIIHFWQITCTPTKTIIIYEIIGIQNNNVYARTIIQRKKSFMFININVHEQALYNNTLCLIQLSNFDIIIRNTVFRKKKCVFFIKRKYSCIYSIYNNLRLFCNLTACDRTRWFTWIESAEDQYFCWWSCMRLFIIVCSSISMKLGIDIYLL